MKLLITGGAGFIGSHFVRYMLQKYSDYEIVNLDNLTYAGRLGNLLDVEEDPNYTFVKGDIADEKLVDELMEGVDMVVNLAAETHVDRSIDDSAPFVHSNVKGTQVLLDAARRHDIKRYVQVSTDEVYGDIENGFFTEDSPLKPSSPYSASKAAGDMLCLAYRRTYGAPIMISRCSNNYGPMQYPEKLVPFFIQTLITGGDVPLYGDGSNVRDWLHVTDHCRALDLILHKGKEGEVYNVGANQEHSNLEITKMILENLGLPEDRIQFVQDRPGHDVRYAIDSTKLQQSLGWTPEIDFEDGFNETVNWYKDIFCKMQAQMAPDVDITINRSVSEKLKNPSS